MTITVLTAEGARQIPALEGQSLLDAIRRADGLRVHAPCGGRGSCRKCEVELITAQGRQTVLACQTEAADGMTVRLREAGAEAVTLRGSAAAGIVPDENGDGCGIACDIGTTTVVCQLVDLQTGAVLAVAGEGNAQQPYGADVIARIQAADDGLRGALTDAIIGQLSRIILDLCAQADIPPARLRKMAVAANTTMCHLFAGLDPSGIGRAPFTPLSLFGSCHDARALGLPFSGEVYIAPAISAYVGGDITADLLAAGLDRASAPTLLIDIGTNGEMALGCGDRFLCCATAAGPAFEGAQISCGMTAAPGAISAVEWRDGELRCAVIGGQDAVGLCGSGLIDAVAVMLELGAVDETGRMLHPDEDDIPAPLSERLFLTRDGEPAFRLSGAVCVTQGDIRRLQLGKAAIAAGTRVLLEQAQLPESGVSALLLAGGFGSYIRPESAARIGLIPQSLVGVTRAVGNAAAEGARCALVSQDARTRLAALREHMHYLELSGLGAFNDAYLDAMFFPEGD